MKRFSLPRREFWDLSVKAFREGRVRWLAHQATKLAGIPLGHRLGRPLCGPVFGTLMITYRCNNSCVMCDYPQRAARATLGGRRELDTAALKAVLGDFAALGTTGMAISGGEPTLRPDLDELLRTVKRLGMVASITTNGSMLADESRAAALLETGIDLVNVSIDGADAAMHDGLRRRPGNFEEVRAAVGHLTRLRSAINPKVVINAVSVLSWRNLHQAEAIMRTALDMGCDRVGFMPVHAFDHLDTAPLGAQGDVPADEPARVAARLKRLRRDEAIDSSDAYLDLIGPALQGRPSELRCYVGYFHSVVDAYGDVFACAPWVSTRPPLGNVTRTPLREVWSSARYAEARREIGACRGCYWNCMTELNLLFNRIQPRRKPSCQGAGPPSRDYRPVITGRIASLASLGSSPTSGRR
jgi:MoaA/NifB/PqqE/SkfB family radical SAM enzyme